MAILPSNTTDFLKEATEKGWKEMPDKTTIGHVHLYVSDIAKAMKFYHQILGLQLTAVIPRASFFAAGWISSSSSSHSNEYLAWNWHRASLIRKH
jgi:catechol 2,3-dioxygenase